VLAVLLYAVACFVPVVPAALAAAIGVGLAVSCLWPTILSVASHRYPDGGATMFAILAAAGNAGCFVMPWVVGVVAAGTALNVGLATAGLCPLILLVPLWRMSREGL
jgi:fucose permease